MNPLKLVQGKVRPSCQTGRGKEARWTGYIEDIVNDQVNVPLEFRQAVKSAPRAIAPSSIDEIMPP